MEKLEIDLSFWKGKRVFLTGHTGFKGSWLCKILINAGANVTGFALAAPHSPNLFHLSNIQDQMNSILGDIRKKDDLMVAYKKANPEIVFHLAAQPLVRYSYENPVYTYETNVMGTVNLLECVRVFPGVKSVLNVTTDKVYENKDCLLAFSETFPLDGFDPYSNSKSCSELVTHCYKKAFFGTGIPALSTARAGNVIGGGDFSENRIIPDCIRAAQSGKKIIVRNPDSVRPYQHVLEPLYAYLMIAQAQYTNPVLAGWYNVGPDDRDCVKTGKLTDIFCESWGENMTWETQSDNGPHEANFLKLDCSLIKKTFGWHPVWTVEEAVKRTIDWSRAWLYDPTSVPHIMDKQINDFKGVFHV